MCDDMRNCYDCKHCGILYVKVYNHYRPMCDYVVCKKTRRPEYMFTAMGCDQYKVKPEESQDEKL